MSFSFSPNWLPDCDAPSDQAVDVPTEALFNWANGLSAYDTPKNFTPTIRHEAPDLTLNNLSATTQDGLTREVSWSMQVSNEAINSNSPLSWMAFKSPSGFIQVSGVENTPGGTLVNSQNGIYQLGQINASQARNYLIKAEYSQCLIDTLWAYIGWSCDNYPASIADISCPEDSFMLRIDPKPANAQLSLNAPPQDTVILFSSTTYDFAIRSTQIANVQNLVLDVFHPGSGLDFIPGSAEMEYPLGMGYVPIPDPVPIPGGYRFIFSNYHSTLADDGLAGLQSGTSVDRQINIRLDLSPNCNFASGDIFYARLGGNMPCGDTLVRQRVMEPIVVLGGAASYSTQYDISPVGQHACDLFEWEVKVVTSGGTTGDFDSLHIWLDTSLVYQPTWFQYINNQFVDSVANITESNDLRKHSWHLTPAMTGPDSVIFRIGIKNPLAGSCNGQNQLQAIMSASYDVPPICQSTGGGETGRDTLTIISDPGQTPEMMLSASGSSSSQANNSMHSWNIRLEHISGRFGTNFNWLSFYSPSGSIQVVDVRNNSTGNMINQVADIWQIDSIAPLQGIDMIIQASAAICEMDSLYVISGWSCDGYPANVQSFSCEMDTILLFAIPDMLSSNLSLDQPVSCFGGNDAIVGAQISGGQSPYNYQWSAGNPTGSLVQNLGAGWLYLSVTDSNNCVLQDSIWIDHPPALSATATATDVSCFGYSNGSVSSQVSGGIPPYNYIWNKNGLLNSSALQAQIAGNYQLRVTDSRGCIDTANTIINQPDEMVLSSGFEDESCSDANGRAWIDVSGGTAGYNYEWNSNPAQYADTASGLSEGNYTVWVTDQQSCRDSMIINITNLEAPTLSTVESRDVSCFGAKDGMIAISASGGTGQYNYSWTHSPISDSVLTDLSAGTYTVVVYDGRCQRQLDISISEPDPISITIDSLLSPACEGLRDGMARISVSGGTQPYQYSWNTLPPQNTETATGLDPGTYMAWVEDDRGCQDSITIAIPNPVVLTAEIGKTDSRCFTDSSGQATITVTGGTTPYSYLWSNGDTAQTAAQLPPGQYEVTATDRRGCILTLMTEIFSPPELQINTSHIDVTCFDGADGEAVVIANGGTGPYLFSWSNGQNGEEISELSAGNYLVKVTDQQGCEKAENIRIDQPDLPLIADFTSEPDLTQPIIGKQLDIQFINRSTGAAQYLWIFGTAGAASNEVNPDFLYAEPGSYTIQLIASDANGNCADTSSQRLILLPPGQIFTANAFSPNGDGFNDIYYVKGESIVELEFRIYNRFGMLIKQINNISEGWDGTINGKHAPEGVYTYTIKAILENGNLVERGGTINLLR